MPTDSESNSGSRTTSRATFSIFFDADISFLTVPDTRCADLCAEAGSSEESDGLPHFGDPQTLHF